MPIPYTSRAMTMLEVLTVLVILGIVIFITLPHLTQSRAAADLAAIKAKATQLNIAKDAYISIMGGPDAQPWGSSNPTVQGDWSLCLDASARFDKIKAYLPNTVYNSANPGATTIHGYTVPGYTLSFHAAVDPNSGAVFAPITFPVDIKDVTTGNNVVY